MHHSLRPVLVLSLVASLLAGLLFTATASAEKPAHPNCWGVVTSQRASTVHDLGEHASQQAEPRLGLRNVARALLGEDAHISDLGTFLAEVDELAVTGCPS